MFSNRGIRSEFLPQIHSVHLIAESLVSIGQIGILKLCLQIVARIETLFHNLITTDTLGGVILCCGELPYTLQHI